LRAILKKAVRDNVILKDPAVRVRHIKVPESIIEYLTTEEIAKLEKTPLGGILGNEVKRAFMFAICTGLRISDIKTLTWGDIDIQKKQIEKRQKKTGRIVYIPLKNEAWTSINDLTIHGKADYVFPVLAVSKTNTRAYLTNWGNKAGVHKLTGWHLARKTAATQMFDAGADIYTVKDILGHHDIETTQRYAKVTDRKRKEAIDALPDYGMNKGSI
jgi:integrase